MSFLKEQLERQRDSLQQNDSALIAYCQAPPEKCGRRLPRPPRIDWSQILPVEIHGHPRVRVCEQRLSRHPKAGTAQTVDRSKMREKG